MGKGESEVSEETEQAAPNGMNAYKIILWCESEEDEPGIAAALDEDRLHEVAVNVQYHIDPAKE